MKRNLDTLRYVLMTTENLDNNLVFVDNYVTDKYSFNEISFHISLLRDDGYIIANPITDTSSRYCDYLVIRLTNKGCDLLDTLRNDGIFNTVKNKVFSTVGSTTLNIIINMALEAAKRRLNI